MRQQKARTIFVGVLGGLVLCGTAVMHDAQAETLTLEEVLRMTGCQSACVQVMQEGVSSDVFSPTTAQILELERRCGRCNDLVRCRGLEEARRCYSGSGGGPPQGTEFSVFGGSTSYDDLDADGEFFAFEAEFSVTPCFLVTGGVQTEEFPAEALGPTDSGGFDGFEDLEGSKLGVGAREYEIPGPVDVAGLSLGGKLFLYRGVYLSAAGLAFVDRGDAPEVGEAALRVGLGYQKTLTARLSARAELRYRLFDELELDGWSAGVGLGFRFGKKKEDPPIAIESQKVAKEVRVSEGLSRQTVQVNR